MNLHFITVIPPPVTGMTLVSQKMLSLLNESKYINVLDLTFSKKDKSFLSIISKHLRYFYKILLASIKSRGNDCIYFVPDSKAGLYVNFFLCSLIMRVGFKKIFFHHHVYSYIKNRKLPFLFFTLTLGKKLHHIFLSEDMKCHASKNYQIYNSIIIGNSIMTSYEKYNHEKKQIITIGFMGNITEEKGIYTFFDVVNELNKNNIFPKIKIAGPAYNKIIKDKLNDFVNKDPHNREWLGPIYKDKKKSFFTDVDIILFPTNYKNEAQPLTIYESFKYSIPVIATNQGSIKEQIRNENWVIKNEEYVTKASNLLSSWISNPEKYMYESKKAIQTFKDAYNRDMLHIKKLINLIKND